MSLQLTPSSSPNRKQTLPEILDLYFTRDDQYDVDSSSFEDKTIALVHCSHPSITSFTSSQFEYQWQFRHTVSYWVCINYIFGSLLFTTGSFFWLIDDYITSNDFYVLVTVAFFAGGITFTIGAYFGYYEVINEYADDKRRPKKRIYCCYSGKKPVNYWLVFVYVLGTILYQLNVTLAVLKIEFKRGSFEWYMLQQMPIFLGGVCFLIGGICQMYVNKAFKCRPTKLGWIISWFDGFGGLCFFIAGVCLFVEDDMVEIWGTIIPYLFGSFSYLVGSILSLLMWKLQQFGLCYLPHLNRGDELQSSLRKKGKNIVFYRDVFFLCFYVVTCASAVTAISYASICDEFWDWIKNFALALMASVVILAIGSFMHSEPERKPFSYLLWFLRFFMVFYTVNLMIDGYHLSGRECGTYGG